MILVGNTCLSVAPHVGWNKCTIIIKNLFFFNQVSVCLDFTLDPSLLTYQACLQKKLDLTQFILLWTEMRGWSALGRVENQTDCGTAAQRKGRKKERVMKENEDPNRMGSLWYSLWPSSRWLHCKAPERQRGNCVWAGWAAGTAASGGAAEVFIFHRNRRFIAQQRGLDFVLVQARHSSRVISNFATKALSMSLFLEQPVLEKQSVTAGV